MPMHQILCSFLALISDASMHAEAAERTDGTEVAGLTPHLPLIVLYPNGTCL